MMRKFRVWDKKEKCWRGNGKTHGSRFFLTQSGELVFSGGEAPTVIKHLLDPSSYVVCYPTGMKDKNDKEICEGDIVKHCYWTDSPVRKKVWWNKIRAEFVVNSTMRIPKSNNEKGFTSSLNDIAIHCEIIGNIYEHPEILSEREDAEKGE